MKKPAFQFYPGDWRKDPNLSRASLEAKGAMIEIMCLAFDCEKRGVLATGRTPWTLDEIAHAIGGDKSKNIKAIKELLKLNVLKKDKKNTIYSSRMVNDDKLSKVRREAGSKGGNPNLVNQKDNQTDNQKPTPSSSSSSSTSINTNTGVAWEMVNAFKKIFPQYPVDANKDLPSCLRIAYEIAKMKGWDHTSVVLERKNDVVAIWSGMLHFVREDAWFSTRAISDLDKEWQRLVQSYKKWVDFQKRIAV